MKESYKYPNSIYSVLLMWMEKRIKEKIISYFKLGNHQVSTIPCLLWIAIWSN